MPDRKILVLPSSQSFLLWSDEHLLWRTYNTKGLYAHHTLVSPLSRPSLFSSFNAYPVSSWLSREKQTASMQSKKYLVSVALNTCRCTQSVWYDLKPKSFPIWPFHWLNKFMLLPAQWHFHIPFFFLHPVFYRLIAFQGDLH